MTSMLFAVNLGSYSYRKKSIQLIPHKTFFPVMHKKLDANVIRQKNKKKKNTPMLIFCVGLSWLQHTETGNKQIGCTFHMEIFKMDKKNTGFTMGISRGPLHWDNKNVVLSEWVNMMINTSITLSIVLHSQSKRLTHVSLLYVCCE